MRGASLTSPPLGKHRTPYSLLLVGSGLLRMQNPFCRGSRTSSSQNKLRARNLFWFDDMIAAEDEESDDGEGGDEGEDEGNEGGVEPCGTAGAGVGLGRGVGLGGVGLGLGGLGGGLGSDGVVVSGGGMDIALLTAMGGAVGGGSAQRVLRASGVRGRPDGCGGGLGDCFGLGGMVGGGRSGRGKGGTIHGLGRGGLVVRLRLGLLLCGSLDGLAGGGKGDSAKGKKIQDFSHMSKIIKNYQKFL